MFDFNAANELLEKNEPLEMKVEETVESAEELIMPTLWKQNSHSAEALKQQASQHTIDSVEKATQALSMALQARKLANTLNESKKSLLRPKINFQKSVNELAAIYLKIFDEIENDLTSKIETWIDTHGDAAYTSGLESMRVEDGSLRRVEKWTANIIDGEALPDEYYCIDHEKIQKAIDAGIRFIPGVKIEMKKEIKLRVKN